LDTATVQVVQVKPMEMILFAAHLQTKASGVTVAEKKRPLPMQEQAAVELAGVKMYFPVQVLQKVFTPYVKVTVFWPVQTHPTLATHALPGLQGHVMGVALLPGFDLVARPQLLHERELLTLNMTVVREEQVQYPYTLFQVMVE
jgi:hypothetical protein